MFSRFPKLISYYRPYRALFALDVACAVFYAAIALVLPLFARHIAEVLLASPTPDAVPAVLSTGALMVLLVVLMTACGYLLDYQGHRMGTLMERDIRNELFAHYQRLSFRFYDNHRTGQLMSRLTNDLNAISEMFHHVPEDLLVALVKFVGAFFIMAAINWQMTAVIFAVLPFVALFALHHNRRMRDALYASRQRLGDINERVEDTLAGIRVVQSFSNQAHEQRRFQHENERFVESRLDGYRSEAIFYSGLNAFIQLLTVGVVVLGGVAIAYSTLTLADLVAYLLLVGILIDPIQKFMNLARLLQEGETGFTRFMEMMEIAPDVIDAPDAVPLPPVQGHIRFENVTFRYREGDVPVLRDVTVDIAAGEYVALVGSSGAGKTTFCSLVPRFYDVSAGRVLIDGHDVRRVQLDTLRRQVGLVQQDVYLFAGTVADNIRYGDHDATPEQIIEAAKRASAHDFIMALPHGYDTDIGQRGVKLSGGQKQRLSIARVFLRDPAILIFDEATSSLDNESERAVQESMERLRHNRTTCGLRRTTLVIAHRLSTIRNADRILVLTEQGIVEQGTHEVLLAAGGVYAALYTQG